eukprot:4783239-Amphidinium_carterae.1
MNKLANNIRKNNTTEQTSSTRSTAYVNALHLLCANHGNHVAQGKGQLPDKLESVVNSSPLFHTIVFAAAGTLA